MIDKIFALALLTQQPSFEKLEALYGEAKKDTNKAKKEAEIENKNLENLGYSSIDVEKNLEGYCGKLFVGINPWKKLIIENLIDYQKQTRDILLSNFASIFRLAYRNHEFFLKTSQKKTQAEVFGNNYYNYQKSRGIFNGIAGKLGFNNALILFGLNRDDYSLSDITRETHIERVRDTTEESGVRIINDYDITTNTNVSSNFDITNQILLLGLGINKKFDFKNTKNKLEFILANEVNDNILNLRQLINTHTRINGNVYVETPYGIDTLAINEEENNEREVNNTERLRNYNVIPILGFESMHRAYYMNLVANKLITPNNSFGDDWNAAITLSLPWEERNQYAYGVFEYNRGGWNFAGKLFVFNDKENFGVIRKKLEEVLKDNQDIKYKEIYLPTEFMERELKLNEIKELKTGNGYILEGGVSYNLLANEQRANIYIGGGFVKKPYALKVKFGINNAEVIFSYKDFDFGVYYLKRQIENKNNEKIEVTLVYGF